MFEVDGYVANDTVISKSWTEFENQNNVYGLVTTPGQDTADVKYLGTFNSASDCWQACNATDKGSCRDWTWHHSDFGGEFAGHCYFTVNGRWGPTAQDKVTSARGP